MTFALLFLAGALVSLALAAAASGALLVQRRTVRGRDRGGFAPAVSIVKPLEGLDDELEHNLESFYALDYPRYEIVFSFARPDDAACAVARRVAGRNPHVATAFIVDPGRPGGNAKVQRLLAGVRRARFEHLLFSDGNVRVPPDFLTKAISFFAEPRVGLVSHLFRATGARSLGSRIESLYLNGILRPGTAAVARLCATPCVVGKSILVSRRFWRETGGLAVLEGFLAEDFLLGRQAQRSGFEVVLSADEIETREISRSLRAAWDRHRRWAILRKRLGGPAYAAEAFASPAGWVAGLALSVLAAPATAPLLAVGFASWGLRLGLEAALAARLGPAWRRGDLALALLRDLSVTGLFLAGLFGTTTVWRGRRMRVGRETRIESVEILAPSVAVFSEDRRGALKTPELTAARSA